MMKTIIIEALLWDISSKNSSCLLPYLSNSMLYSAYV